MNIYLNKVYLYFYRRLQLVHQHILDLLPQQAEVEGEEGKVVLQIVW